MAFENVTFPFVPLIHDQVREVIDPVSVSSNGTFEYRIRRARWESFIFRVPTQTMTDPQKETVRTFLSKRRAGLNSFKYTDPAYKEFISALLSFNSTTFWNLNLPFDTSTAGTAHPVFKVGTLTATKNGSPATVLGTSIIAGQPVVQISGSISTDIIKVSGPIFFVVRLDSNFNEALTALQCSDNRPFVHTVGEIRLVEVFGEF